MLSVTPRAQERLSEILAERGSPGDSIRIDVVRGPHGCIHGWRLGMEDRENPEAQQDVAVQVEGLRVVMAPDLRASLEGATIDYREDESQIGFSIDAPHTEPPSHEGHPAGHGGHCHH